MLCLTEPFPKGCHMTNVWSRCYQTDEDNLLRLRATHDSWGSKALLDFYKQALGKENAFC